ncbi:MAG: VCBS repeat-containing protein [Tannerellaceae bacterium]|jgi:hypothetical protein|nr:VCBS repeat-containing protein [Tannerellaceae bacterium]
MRHIGRFDKHAIAVILTLLLCMIAPFAKAQTITLNPVPVQMFTLKNGLVITPAKKICLRDYVASSPGAGPMTFTGSTVNAVASFNIAGDTATVTAFPSAVGVETSFTYTVTHGSYTANGTVIVRVIEGDKLPGFIDPVDITSCFDNMGTVTFTARSVMSSTPEVNYCSVPLIADLNHDGKPEIINLYTTYPAGLAYGYWRGVLIYDQAWNLTAQLPFRNSSNQEMVFQSGADTYHWPMNAALVDSDRDGTVELIFTAPNGGSNNNNYRNRVISYKLVWSGTTYSLQENPKWGSWPEHNTGNTNYFKPMPQICDFDGDGVPEIMVYNKIFNAVNGQLLQSYTGLGTALATDNSNGGTHPGFIGLNRLAPNGLSNGDKRLAYAAIYDIAGGGPEGKDPDGIYDVVAGGKIYVVKNTVGGAWPGSPVQTFTQAGVNDGFTAVGDVDGDDIPDVVTINSTANSSTGGIQISVWNQHVGLIAQRSFSISGRSTGSNSYVFVGDIDGREQIVNGVTYRLPEIAVLSGDLAIPTVTVDRQNFIHPNVYSALTQSGTTNGNGVLFAVTIDKAAGVSTGNKLKLSFVLEHEDSSTDTGFTMFDFDNDGINEICYRDMVSLRILKPVRPYVTYGYTGSDVILLKQAMGSYTGFEFPVIADIDGDSSADMVVTGGASGSTNNYSDPMWAIFSNGDKFAPAWPVWNQPMYDPFKIRPDSITTPIGPAPNRLQYKFDREIKNAAGQVTNVIKDYQPFNGNLIQATYIDPAVFPKYEPLVYLIDAYIDDHTTTNAPRIRRSGTNTCIDIRIGNRNSANSAIAANLPVRVYKNNKVDPYSTYNVYSSTLATVYNGGTTSFVAGNQLGTAFKLNPGAYKDITINLGNLSETDIYIVRLGDDSNASAWRFGVNGGDRYGTTFACPDFNEGIGVATKPFRDCNWCNQVVRAARYQTISDFYTIQEFCDTTMYLLTNDILPVLPKAPDTFSFMDTVRIGPWNIITPPKAGYLTFNNVQGPAAAVTYHHDARAPLPLGIDSFQYSMTYWDEAASPPAIKTSTSTAYIYVIKSSSGGFSTCYNTITNIKISENPTGVRFNWFNALNQPIETGTIEHITGQMLSDSVYFLKPIMTGITGAPGQTLTAAQLNYYKALNFPLGKITVRLVTYPAKPTSMMRWTGHVNRQWRDPRNWVEVLTDNGREVTSPVSYAPAECSNVIIPSNVNYYPELADSANCNNIALKDRAMLRNPHMLKYAAASVEFKLKGAERDRFVMWSAPLMSMYSGDYHSRTGNAPQWGDVFMNRFQFANPDGGGTPEVNRFTATFAAVDHPLPLGAAFNLKVTTTTATRDSLLRFPRAENSYTLPGGTTVNLPSRTNRAKFITHGKTLNAQGQFQLDVSGDMTAAGTQRLVQIVNPYMAYLSVDSFLKYNTNISSGYYIWNGEVGADMTALAFTSGNRISVTTPPLALQSPSLAYIPPLQSFFVAKTSAGTPLGTVNMSPYWTTTSPTAPYTLRASTMVKSGGVMNIALTNGAKSAHAAMIHTIGSGPSLDREDMPAVIHTVDNETSLAVYTYSTTNEPLAINSSEHFNMTPVSLGITVKTAGEYRLEFTNLETFGYDVTLVDKQQGNKQTDLRQNPAYSFAVTNPAGSPIVELNNRFELRFTYTGKGITITGVEPVNPSPALHVAAGRGYVEVSSTEGPIESLQVYDAAGRRIYNNPGVNSARQRISIAGNQAMYIIKAIIGGRLHTAKAIIR